MKLFKHVLLALAVVFCVDAQAQRIPVPIVDFKDVPVSASVAKPVSATDVRNAFLRAATAQRWVLTPVSDGVMEAKFVKDNKHTVVAKVTYDAQRYAISYESSIDMKFEPGPNVSPSIASNSNRPNLAERAAMKQKDLFANDPLTPYAVMRRDGALHPFYEVWVRRLLAGVSTELKIASS